jgi:hypothetical protein
VNKITNNGYGGIPFPAKGRALLCRAGIALDCHSIGDDRLIENVEASVCQMASKQVRTASAHDKTYFILDETNVKVMDYRI